MTNKEILEVLNLGSSVAENDENLVDYFVPTAVVRDFVTDRYDLIRGVKGSGKSAVLKVVVEQQHKYPELGDVRLVVATEHSGEPSFKRAFETLKLGEVKEVELVSAWKTYLINLALDAVDELPDSVEKREAIAFAEKSGLRYHTTSPFKKIWWSLLRILHIKKFTIGVHSVSAEFPDAPPDVWTRSEEVIDFPESHRLCIQALREAKVRCWILIDRLDAAFQEDQALERAALRALVIAYKDFIGHKELRPKMFFRTDLFEQVAAESGFRELTHVQDRTSPPISWDSDKLLHMIMERFAFNAPIVKRFGFSQAEMTDPKSREKLFFAIYPKQVDVGLRKPDTWTWMLSRIRDGNGVRTPRDLHNLAQNSARRQLEVLNTNQERAAQTLIEPSAIKSGLSQLSKDKISATLIAENPTMETAIRAFTKQKAEQNANGLEKILGDDWKETTERLVRIGFLEEVGSTWKVPMLYRDGLEIVQGAAFDRHAATQEEDE